MKTGQEYVENLRSLNTKIYAFGEQVKEWVDDPLFRPHINAAALTYDLVHDPVTEDLVTAVSHLTGKRINRFTNIHQNPEDLVKKVKMLRLIAQKTGSCFQRCVCFDAINATYSTTYEMDQAGRTDYHRRFKQLYLILPAIRQLQSTVVIPRLAYPLACNLLDRD